MRKATKPPSEWLKLLCKEWAIENTVLVETADAKFLDYKPYLKGLLTSQLLCRLSIPSTKDTTMDGSTSQSFDFWEILGISDSFDRAYIIAQVCLSLSLGRSGLFRRMTLICLVDLKIFCFVIFRSSDSALCTPSARRPWMNHCLAEICQIPVRSQQLPPPVSVFPRTGV